MKSQKGFTPIVLILIAAVFLAAIGGAYYLINLKKQYTVEVITGNQQTTPSPASGATATDSASETSSWKTATSNLAKFTIKYPPDWKNINSTNNGGTEEIWLSNSGFTMNISSFTKESLSGQNNFKANPSGSCNCTVDSSEMLTIPGYGSASLDIIEQGVQGTYIKDLKISTKQGSSYIQSPKSEGVYSTFEGYKISTNTDPNAPSEPLDSFNSSTDVQTAKKIFQTLSY